MSDATEKSLDANALDADALDESVLDENTAAPATTSTVNVKTTVKLKQRLIGLVLFGLVLLVFLPLMIEEPVTYLAVLPVRIPAVLTEVSLKPLFSMISDDQERLEMQVRSERAWYAKTLSEKNVAEKNVTEKTLAEGHDDVAEADKAEADETTVLPLDFLSERLARESIDSEPLEQQDLIQQGNEDFVLSRVWVVRLKTATARTEELEALRSELQDRRIRTFIRSVSGESSRVFELLAGPELLRTRAESVMHQVQAAFPDLSPVLIPYAPD
ncbi:MAG: hypothetical protein P8176_03245 [Gammaproteobacteria bacterium]